MGILKSGLLGPFQNKVGSVVGRRHRKQNVITGLHRTSNKPFTPAQLEVQLKLGLLNSFLNQIDKLVNIGFKAAAKNGSPVNEAFSYNYDHAFVKEGDIFLINYPKIIYSRGHIVPPESPQVVSNGDSVVFSWPPQSQSAYCQFTDLASFLVYNPIEEKHVIVLNAINRYKQGYTIKMPPGYLGDTVHCYMNFASADGKKTGDSIHVGTLTL